MPKRQDIMAMRKALLRWYDKKGRDLPWRHTKDPYAILISEVMLQQTQVERVIPKYFAWLEALPTVQALAKAPLPKVLGLWSGLGYNNRVVRLKKMAQVIVKEYGGKFPSDYEQLLALPGLGPYTAGAVLTFAFDQPVAIVDTNIRRVFSRIFFGVQGPKSKKELEKKVMVAVSSHRPADWNHALMDHGATVCVSRRPKCEVCPLQEWCKAYPKILAGQPISFVRKQPKFTDSNRFWRGRIVATLLTQPSMTLKALQTELRAHGSIPVARLQGLLADLRADGLLEVRGETFRLSRR